jgi:hypothetical protein
MVQILGLDSSGSPADWLSVEKAAYYVAKGAVAWDLGETCVTLRGGMNSGTGEQSILELKPIICINGPFHTDRPHKSPPLTRAALFRRDLHICAYCGEQFRESELTLDHIHPQARGGGNDWMNLVAACKVCNNRKDCRTPEEARMPLLYVPYVPNLYEKFILENRVILADQREFLLARVSKNSRLLS